MCIMCFQSQYNVYLSAHSSLLPLVQQQFIPTITVSAVYNELFWTTYFPRKGGKCSEPLGIKPIEGWPNPASWPASWRRVICTVGGCVPPFDSVGRGGGRLSHSLGGGGLRVEVRTREQTLWLSKYIYALCDLYLLRWRTVRPALTGACLAAIFWPC